MSRKSFLYFLFSEKKKPLYVDDNGHVQEGNEDYKKPDGQPANLKYSPFGWKDVLVKYARNVTFWGIFRDMTVPMKFVKDGARILHNRMWKTVGIEAICYLGILKLDRTQLPYNYDGWYLSDINFAKYKEAETGVNVEALEGGMSKYFKANQNTTYEIPIDTDEEHINVLMDGMEFDYTRTFSIVPDQQLYAVPNYYLGMVETAREGNAPDIIWQDIYPKQSGPYPNEDWYSRFDRVTASSGSATFSAKGFIKVRFDRADTYVLRVEVNDAVGAGSTQTDLVNIVGASRPAGTIETFPFDISYSVPSGSRAHMKIFTGSNTGSLLQITVLEGEISLGYVYRYRPTYIKGHFPFRVLDLLTGKASDAKHVAKSSWLEPLKTKCITSGDALRGIVTDTTDPDHPVKGAVIKTSLNDYIKSHMAIFSAGAGVENDKMIVEQFAYFFGSNTIADIGTVKNADMIIAEDLIGNTIKAGYQKRDYQDANGRFETNQGQQWTTPLTKIVKELDLQSIYRTDPFGIEQLRINFDQRSTSDSESDNDTFILDIDPTPYVDSTVSPAITYYKLNRPAYTTITGIPHPASAFNMELTPKKNLLNNGAYLHSLMDMQDPFKIKQTSADKNAVFTTTLAGVTVTENEDIQIGSLPAQLFLPYYFNLTTQVPVNLLSILKTDPYGKIKFTWNNLPWYGYLVDGGIKPADNDVQVWKLLAAAGQDLSKFNGNAF